MKSISAVLVILSSLALAPALHAADYPRSAEGKETAARKTDSGDRKFVQEAATAGMAEVELAKLAQERATQPKVKEYAQHLINDHEQANEKLKALAAQKNIELPTELDRKHQRERERLSKMSGPDFDRAYIEAMVKDHKDVLNRFEKQAKRAEDPQIRSYAADTTPVLRQHLEQARQLQEQVKKSANRDAS